MSGGVDTVTGFTKKTIDELMTEVQEDHLSNIDPGLNLASSQPLAQVDAAFCKKTAELWELAEIAYNGFSRDAADGRQLDNIGSITGTTRENSRKTKIVCTLGLDAGKTFAPGTLMANVVGQPDFKFTNRDTVTSTTAGAYTGQVFEAVAFGPIHVNAGTLTAITNSVTGWNTITNPLDGEPGALVETDDTYRVRQDDELFSEGSSTTDAIRVDVLEVKGVEQAFCFENVTMFTNTDGLPAKAIEVVIFDGLLADADNDEVAQAIWNSKPSGSESHGSSSGTAIDSLGRVRIVNFTRAAIRDIFLEFDVTVDPTTFPIDGISQIKTVAVEKANARSLDDDVIALAVRASVLESSNPEVPGVKGVKDVGALRLGFAAGPTNTANLVIASREIASFDTSRVVVNFV